MWFLLLIWYIQGITIRIQPAWISDNQSSETPDSLQLILSSRISAKNILQICKDEWQKCFPAVRLSETEGKTNIEKYNSLIKNKRH
jgi:hypothetical protein